MTCLSRRTAVSDEGNALITTILISMVVGLFASLALVTGTFADRSSTSDRNHEQSLGVAEAAVHQVIERISAQASGADTSSPNFWSLAFGATTPASCAVGGSCPDAKNDPAYSGSTAQGSYWYWITRCDPHSPTDPCRTPTGIAADGFIVDTQSASGGTSLRRGRHVQVTLIPPARFPEGKNYAMFSYTSIAIQNNDQVLDGDVFANDNISISQSNHNTANDPTLRGSLTAARGWINIDSSVLITGNVWSGGPDYTNHWAITMGGNSRVEGWVRASNTTPGQCSDANYNVPMANGAVIAGSLTTLGTKSTQTGSVIGSYVPNTCTPASPPEPPPSYTFNPDLYGPEDYAVDTCPAHNGVCRFSSVANFQTWFASNKSNFQGAYLVDGPGASQANRIDLSGAIMTGSVTIVTDAPIYTGNLDDSQVPGNSATLVLVSHYQPPTATGCDTEHDTSDCAVHIKNNFALNANGTCKTATLVHADKGPVAIKNGQTLCGSVEADGILVKNNQQITYDDRITRIVGFGNSAYAIARWQELAPQ